MWLLLAAQPPQPCAITLAKRSACGQLGGKPILVGRIIPVLEESTAELVALKGFQVV